jgi:hypothetical protein
LLSGNILRQLVVRPAQGRRRCAIVFPPSSA